MVRDMPPPAPPTSKALTTTTTPGATPSTTTSDVAVIPPTQSALAVPGDEHAVHGELIDEEGESVRVIGGHSYPSGPGMYWEGNIHYYDCDIIITREYDYYNM